jgi:UDP-N-acetyl-D-mannosaminuronic acid dehydrogenase
VKKFEYPLLSFDEALQNSNLVIVEVDHDEFRALDAKKISRLVRNRIVLDTKHIINKEEFLKHGFQVHTLGAK